MESSGTARSSMALISSTPRRAASAHHGGPPGPGGFQEDTPAPGPDLEQLVAKHAVQNPAHLQHLGRQHMPSLGRTQPRLRSGKRWFSIPHQTMPNQASTGRNHTGAGARGAWA